MRTHLRDSALILTLLTGTVFFAASILYPLFTELFTIAVASSILVGGFALIISLMIWNVDFLSLSTIASLISFSFFVTSFF